jgi:hypothetical protein
VSLVSSVAVLANALGLPWLVKGLKEEDINSPLQQSADTLIVEPFGIRITDLRFAVVGAAVWEGRISQLFSFLVEQS